MKTTEEDGKYSHFALHRNENIERRHHEDTPFNNENANEERIIATYHPKEKTYYFDNSAISMLFGQNNLEKCLIVMLLVIVYSACLIYNYYQFFNLFGIICIASGEALDGIIIFFFLYFIIKLRNENIFMRISLKLMNISDLIIIIDFIVKIATFLMITFNDKIVENTPIIVFTIKFIIEFYFVLISIRMFVLSPCSIYIHEQSEKFWNMFMHYVCCTEIEENASVEYTRIEDLESFY